MDGRIGATARAAPAAEFDEQADTSGGTVGRSQGGCQEANEAIEPDATPPAAAIGLRRHRPRSGYHVVEHFSSTPVDHPMTKARPRDPTRGAVA
jgi:hypothetical protein